MSGITIDFNGDARVQQLQKRQEEMDDKLVALFPIIPKPVFPPPDDYLPTFEKKDLTLDRNIGFIPDADQARFERAFYEGKSLVLLGSAGAGKSTIMGYLLNKVITRLPPIGLEDETYYRDIGVNPVHSKYTPGMPGFAGCAYTIRATSIIANSCNSTFNYTYEHRLTSGEVVKGSAVYQADELFNTLNSFAGYKPKTLGESMTEDEDEEETATRSNARFNASRDRENPNDPEFRLVVIDEASFAAMVSLGSEVLGSIINSTTQVVIMGDLSQVQAIGGMSILQMACMKLPVYELTGQHRSAGVLLNFVQSLRDDKLAEFFLRWCPDKCTAKGKLKSSNKAITIADDERKVMILPFSYKEQQDANLSQEKIANLIFGLVDKGFITLGVHLVLIPHRTGQFGSIAVMEQLYEKLDVKYDRANYLYHSPTTKPNAEDRTVMAVGDIMQMNREPHLVVGIYPNPTYNGDTPAQSFKGRPRSADVWMEIQEAHESVESRNVESTMLLEVDDKEIDFEHEVIMEMTENALDSDISDDEIVKMGKTSHHLLLLDLAQLLAICKQVYEDKESYQVQAAIVNLISKWAMYYDSQVESIMNATELMVEFRMKSAFIAAHFGIPNLEKCFILFTGAKQLDEHSRAAMTAYQCQGSESPIAITVVHPKMVPSQVTNEPVFTMVSRARETTILCCPTTYLNGTKPNFSPAARAINGVTVEEKLAITSDRLQNLLKDGDVGIEDAVDILEMLEAQNQYKKGSEEKLWWEHG